ncbi:DNA methyltransferase [Orenia marismortui]|uniref:DNA methyltransferase n=1 Tax=Orenia marismortui TaxID=46469 RepID=UPI00036542F0|nr:DNA methyltransferase [Orenia marismortui]
MVEENIRYKQRFFSSLKDLFVGERIEGNSGYVNLMYLRNQYFKEVRPYIEEKINNLIQDPGEQEVLFEKLFTFFESYFNETGSVFFNNTPIHKNLYEKVYSNEEDVSLFWKTKKLYYVKSESNYISLDTEIEGIKFKFDASELEHEKGNEKYNITFVLTSLEDNEITLKVKKDKTNSYTKAKEHLNINKNRDLKDYLIENREDISHPNINMIINDIIIDDDRLTKGIQRNMVLITEKDDLIGTVEVEFGVKGVENIKEYLNRLESNINFNNLKKACSIYRKQNEVDYFIHKNAEAFLKEQFKIYMFNYIYNSETDFKKNRVTLLNKIREITFSVIEYIARFEDELKAIWEKPKFVRNSNYVLTLDKLENDIELVEEIINHQGFDNQIKEWQRLYENEENHEGEEIKKQWKEFDFINDFNKESIIADGRLNEKYRYLPIDTKHFKEIEGKILDSFNNLNKYLDGILIKSDNFQALNTILPKYKEQVDLIYIDPPFNTGDDFDYKDKFQDSTWLTLMNDRLGLAKQILTRGGTFYLHIDYNANHYAKILMQNHKFKYRNEIIWHFDIGTAPKFDLKRKHNVILRYSKGEDIIFNEIRKEALNIDRYDKTDEDGRKYMVRGDTGKIVYADEGQAEDDVWSFISSNSLRNLNSMSNERIGFKTQKPEYLINKITKLSTKKNSIVMDFFSGSGSTISTAQKKGNKWIGIEMGEHFYTKILPRMKKVLVGDQAGISDEVDWQGGGFFKYYELEQYEEVLNKCKYKLQEKELSSYSFNNDEKMLDALEMDYDEEKIKIHFQNLYPDVDIAETLSNLLGKKIKKLNGERVIFEDDTEIVFDDMTYEDYSFVKPLIWWGNDNE